MRTINELEANAIEKAIHDNNFDLTKTAKAMGIGRATLYRKMKQYGIDFLPKPNTSKKYIEMSISDASVAKEGCMVMMNRWWTTDGKNIFFFHSYASPQCNSNKRIAQQIADIRKHDVVFMPIVFVPHNCSDYI